MTNKYEDLGQDITVTANVSLLELFDKISVTSLEGIRVFDVGQGDCIGLLDQNNKVFCYIDYGGLNDHPDKNNPSATPSRLPVKLKGKYVSIVLTHWDKDHYWSANKKNSDAQNCEWLVPRQMVSPQAVLFARNLGNAKCWPESRGDQPESFGVGRNHSIEIRKCDKHDITNFREDRNLSGLAILLIQQDDANSEMTMLLPGDCPFNKIPNLRRAPIRALVAYHHGSHIHWSNKTTSSIQNVHSNHEMVYSFGKNNFGHPDRSNYQPDWDKKSYTTEEVRINGDKSKDVSWK